MTDTSLKPECVLRAGFVGHRPGKLIASRASVRETITGVLNDLDELGRLFADDRKSMLYASGGLKKRLTTGLAPGADRDAAGAGLDLGWALQAVLPRDEQAFIAEQAPSAGSLPQDSAARLRELSSRARTLTLSGDGPWRTAHELAARVVIEQSDVLLAVWDGASAAGLGGTAHVVRMALQSGVGVIWIDAADASQIRYLLPGRHADCTWHEFRDFLSHSFTLPTGPADESSRPQDSAMVRWQRFLHERARPSWFPPLYQCLLCLSGQKLPKFRLRPEDSLANWNENWQKYLQLHPDADMRAAAEKALQPRFHHLDHLAEVYGRAYRATYLMVYLLAFLATLSGLFGVLVPELKAQFVGVELLLIAGMATLVWIGRRRSWHERWLDYRAVAEKLRHARLGLWTGQSFVSPSSTGLSPGSAWTEWLARAVAREIPLPNATVDADYCRNALRGLDRYELKGQLRFNSNTAKRQHRMHHLFDLGEVALLAVLAVVLTAFLALWAGTQLDWLHPPAGLKSNLKLAVSFSGIAIPALGAVLLGIRAQGEFIAYSERATETAKHIAAVREELGPLLDENLERPEFEDVVEVSDAAVAALSTDVHAWRSVYRRKSLSVAA